MTTSFLSTVYPQNRLEVCGTAFSLKVFKSQWYNPHHHVQRTIRRAPYWYHTDDDCNWNLLLNPFHTSRHGRNLIEVIVPKLQAVLCHRWLQTAKKAHSEPIINSQCSCSAAAVSAFWETKSVPDQQNSPIHELQAQCALNFAIRQHSAMYSGVLSNSDWAYIFSTMLCLFLKHKETIESDRWPSICAVGRLGAVPLPGQQQNNYIYYEGSFWDFKYLGHFF